MSDLTKDVEDLRASALLAKYVGELDRFHELAQPELIVGLISLLLQTTKDLRSVRAKNAELRKEAQYSVPLRLYREALEKTK